MLESSHLHRHAIDRLFDLLRGASPAWACCNALLVWLLVSGAQCGPEIAPPNAVTFSIDPALSSPTAPATVISAGQERPVGLAQGPDGETEAFVIDEVMIRAETQEELQAFLDKYGGIVLRDGTVSNVPTDEQVVEVERSSWYLVRVDLTKSSLDDLPNNVEAVGIEGHLFFSSEDAARLMAIVAREAKDGVGPNHLLRVETSPEHPTGNVDSYGNPTFIDFEQFFWMTEDDNPFAPDDQGLSIGVTHAWEFLAYNHIPPAIPTDGSSVFFTPVRVAVIDVGFALDTTTGAPLLNNRDYLNVFSSFTIPLQYDERDDDSHAGGINDDIKNSQGGSGFWHGQGSFSVCCAAERNHFGAAGVGGPVSRPILIRAAPTAYQFADSFLRAANMGATVITTSMSVEHGIGSRILDFFWDNNIDDAVIECTRVGAIVLAAAGNEGRNLDDFSLIPCEVVDVICVGSITRAKTTNHNFGRNVAISGPEGVTVTVNPVTAEADNNADDVGFDELDTFGGTSCATPFVAGVVALMKAADPTLKRNDVLRILQDTANPADPVKVPNGYVDAYRAVKALLPANLPPTIQITQPSTGQSFGWKTTPFFRTVYSDPEVDPTDVNRLLRFPATVIISSSIDGELCSDSSPPYECASTLPELTLGQHVITTTANDGFDGVATHQIIINVVNGPPQADIIKPVSSATLFSHIPVEFVASAVDFDEQILDSNISWSSSRDDQLGTGLVLTKSLTEGAHTITLTVVDGKGLTAADQVNITVMAGAGFPTPVITSPASGELFGPGQQVTLTGSATDPEDGILGGASLEWSSSRDGVLGTGNSITVTPSFDPSSTPGCAGGAQHTITLKATDSNNRAVTVSIVLNVGCIL